MDDVVIWRHELIASTETFIVNQALAMTRHRPLFAGLYERQGSLRVTPTLLLTPDTRLGGQQRRVLRATRRSRRLRELLRRPSVRLVHAHFGPDGAFVAPEAERAGVPLVVTFRGYDVTLLPHQPVAGPLYRRRLHDLFERADALLTCSDYLGRRLLELGAPPEKVATQYTGLPLRPFTEPPPARRVVFVGRLIEYKGVDDLLHAVARLPGGPVPVVLFGDGDRRAEVEALARSLGVPAEFRGHGSVEVVRRELSAGGVFCAASKTSAAGQVEAFGNVFVEAAAQGLPVVAYRSGGVVEAAQDGVGALLADEGDVDGLSARLATLFDDPALARTTGLAGRRRVEEQFDIVGRTAELERRYDRVVAAHGRGRGAARPV